MKHYLFLLFSATALLFSCESKDESIAYSSEIETALDSTIANGSIESQKFIRTANLEMNVENVDSTVHAIEQLTQNIGGYAESVKLSKSASQVYSKKYSMDSILQTTVLHPNAELVLKIPNTNLDEVVNKLGSFATIVVHREMTCTDASAQLEANQLTIQRAQKIADVAKQADVKTRLNYLSNGKSDESVVSLHNIKREIELSTLHIKLYQPEIFIKEVVFDSTNDVFSKPSFGVEVLDALSNGIQIARSFFIWVLKLWFVWLFSFIVWIGYNRFKRTTL